MKLTEKRLARLKAITADDYELNERRELVAKPVNPTVFERDGSVYVSAEDGCHFADYYGESNYRSGGYAWIHPKLEAFANSVGGYWDWQDPGTIYLGKA